MSAIATPITGAASTRTSRARVRVNAGIAFVAAPGTVMSGVKLHGSIRPRATLPSSFTAARAIAVGRRVVPWVVGPAVLLLRRDVVELAAPSVCPGLLELITVGLVRLRPDVRVRLVFDLLRVAIITVGLAAFTAFVWRETRNIAVAIAVAAAIGFSPLFPAMLAPPWEAAAFGVCAVVAWLAASMRVRGRRRPVAVRAIAVAALVTAAVVVPPWLLGRTANPQTLAACVLPPAAAQRVADAVAAVPWWLGPAALGLAVLGVFVDISRSPRRTILVTAAGAIASIVLLWALPLSAPVALAPALVVLWRFTASGLHDVIQAMGRSVLARVAAAALLVLLPALAASRRGSEERDDQVRPRGHEQQTLRGMTRLLNLVPQATFVEEDATVDALLRAANAGGRRRAKPITVIAPTADAVGRALSSQTVYAFPWRQDDLSLRGFVVEAVPSVRVTSDSAHTLDGVAAVTGRRRCQAVEPAWADFSGASDRIALSADSLAARGPAVILLGGKTAGGPQPDGWSPRTVRGFGFFTFDQLTPAGTERLAAEARATGLPSNHPLLGEPFVVRLNLHRTPRAPLALPVILGGSFPVGATRLDPAAVNVGHLTICDAPAIAVSSFAAGDQ